MGMGVPSGAASSTVRCRVNESDSLSGLLDHRASARQPIGGPSMAAGELVSSNSAGGA